MGITTLIVLGMVVAFLWVLSGLLIRDGREGFGFIFFIFGVAELVLFSSVSSYVLRDGSPKLDIKAGEYKVAFVYEVGERVSVGVEKEQSFFDGVLSEIKEEKRLFLYQFLRDAFEGDINHNAKKLVVVETGEFKKLRLE